MFQGLLALGKIAAAFLPVGPWRGIPSPMPSPERGGSRMDLGNFAPFLSKLFYFILGRENTLHRIS